MKRFCFFFYVKSLLFRSIIFAAINETVLHRTFRPKNIDVTIGARERITSDFLCDVKTTKTDETVKGIPRANKWIVWSYTD